VSAPSWSPARFTASQMCARCRSGWPPWRWRVGEDRARAPDGDVDASSRLAQRRRHCQPTTAGWRPGFRSAAERPVQLLFRGQQSDRDQRVVARCEANHLPQGPDGDHLHAGRFQLVGSALRQQRPSAEEYWAVMQCLRPRAPSPTPSSYDLTGPQSPPTWRIDRGSATLSFTSNGQVYGTPLFIGVFSLDHRTVRQ
jgi:hypothetical protein